MTPVDPTAASPLLYGVYILLSVALTLVLAGTLFRNGRTFLHDVFTDKPDMADALNRLLVVGFFLLNAGYALLIFRGEDARAVSRPLDFAIDRMGLLLVTLGIIHFVNMAVFWKIRTRTMAAEAGPPAPAPNRIDPYGPNPHPVGPNAGGPNPAAPPPVRWDLAPGNR